MSRKMMPGFGKSGMSRMRLRRSIMRLLYHIDVTARRPRGGERREVVERIPRHVVLADLEVQVRPGSLARAAHDPDDVALPHLVADPPTVLAVVRVDGRVALIGREEAEVPVAAAAVAAHPAPPPRPPARRALRRADVAPVVVAVAARAEGGAHEPRLHRPDERRRTARQLGRRGAVVAS